MAGLVPAIHVLVEHSRKAWTPAKKDVDARAKRGHDGVIDAAGSIAPRTRFSSIHKDLACHPIVI
jgi:hypothetical protein